MSDPLAYLITWTTHGTWLPGDRRGWVTKQKPGIQAYDEVMEAIAERSLTDSPVILGPRQREIVEQTIRRHCDIRAWTLHALNVRSNHVHMVVTAPDAPETVMVQLKAWCSRRLNEADGRRKWWTEHGSTKWINDEAYLANAIRYVLEGQ